MEAVGSQPIRKRWAEPVRDCQTCNYTVKQSSSIQVDVVCEARNVQHVDVCSQNFIPNNFFPKYPLYELKMFWQSTCLDLSRPQWFSWTSWSEFCCCWTSAITSPSPAPLSSSFSSSFGCGGGHQGSENPCKDPRHKLWAYTWALSQTNLCLTKC